MDSDLIFGIFVTAVFLVLVFAAGFALNKVKNARYNRAWQPLVPVISGTPQSDGGGSASSWLHGSYGGKPVAAGMAPNAKDSGRSGSMTTGFAYNGFEIVLGDLPGKHDWSVTYAMPASGGTQEWQIIAADPALKERLAAAGIVALTGSLGYPTDAVVGTGLPVLGYSARDGQLRFREDAGPVWLPTPERFREELDVLAQVAAINAQVNGV